MTRRAQVRFLEIEIVIKAYKHRLNPECTLADQAKIGTEWKGDELDAIVADYLAMLAADLQGRPYVKASHRRALMEVIGRTHRSGAFDLHPYSEDW